LYRGLSSVSLTSCKAKAKAVATTVTEPVDYMKAAKIIGNHYNNKSNFLHYILEQMQSMLMTKQTQNVTAEIKIKKDEQILVSIRFLGITMQKH
jgi:AAA+ superfamily predicted ATPase